MNSMQYLVIGYYWCLRQVSNYENSDWIALFVSCGADFHIPWNSSFVTINYNLDELNHQILIMTKKGRV
ncbi:hypothetical protein QL285_074953 [Trifolium repens]|nr:hypothetical protein QL285_074953 [Trifolium repens]